MILNLMVVTKEKGDDEKQKHIGIRTIAKIGLQVLKGVCMATTVKIDFVRFVAASGKLKS